MAKMLANELAVGAPAGAWATTWCAECRQFSTTLRALRPLREGEALTVEGHGPSPEEADTGAAVLLTFDGSGPTPRSSGAKVGVPYAMTP